ncbi:LOW QUALITY PROTEIN: coiled-coil domain-containing protein 24 [Eleutherodactylus coqui]|uniref:LOW QUALITY PROTEIN: coiled-coil domain-containing protein 24 n=1 Tax=Eleutherodactylus coqui TaxID=57060 RepID=UPI0034633EF8
MLRPASGQDSGYGELLEPPPSLWSLVEGEVPRSERAEVKRILGEAAVDLSLDLHAEMVALLEVRRDIRSTCASAGHRPPSSSISVLVDPPVVKNMVTQEIRMLLLSVRARHQGLDGERAFSKYNPKVVSFVMGTERPESRARPEDSRTSDPPPGGSADDERPLSSLSNMEDDLEELKDKLQISQIDEVLLHLRALLAAECQMLEAGVKILQQHLEAEHQYMEAEPSLTELKEERRVLELDLQLCPLPAPPPARLLDLGSIGAPRKSPAPQHEPSKTLPPPDPKLKSPEGSFVRGDLTGPGATSRRPQGAGPSSPPRCLCEQGRGPGGSLSVTSDRAAPVTSVNTLRVPRPPKAQRPLGSVPTPAFRRVRTPLMNVPP